MITKLKYLYILIILCIASIGNAQDTTRFFKIVDFGKPTQIKYECFVIHKYNGEIDTVCVEKGKGSSQGFSDSTKIELTDNEKEVLYFLEQLNKIEQEQKKVTDDANKKMQELNDSKNQLIGVLTYTSKKYGIDINELIKKLQK